jgi:hypothetical protein
MIVRRLKPGDHIQTKTGIKVIEVINIADKAKIKYHDGTIEYADPESRLDLVMAD